MQLGRGGSGALPHTESGWRGRFRDGAAAGRAHIKGFTSAPGSEGVADGPASA